jgi:predicted nucleic acid-binding Zn ribbon protein
MMPRFDYRCGDEIVERYYPIDVTPPAEVEEEGKHYIRVFNAPATIYKGLGFTTTDKADSITKWQREHAS